MGKEKAGFLTPKAIANRIKSKGLQKLRWYCQMCQKQCRDENGFKCHTMSESHQRQLLLFADNPDKFLDGYSQEFEKEFMTLLSRQFGTKRVQANQVYMEYIKDKDHLHMNSTTWHTLTAFVQYLGKEGKCKVDHTEKGWFIQYIDRGPETIQAEIEKAKKEKMETTDEEKQAKFLEKQIKLAKAGKEAEMEEAEYTKLMRENDDEKVAFNFDSGSCKSGSFKVPASTTVANPLLTSAAGAKRKSKPEDEASDSKKKKPMSAMEEIMLEESKRKEEKEKERLEKEKRKKIHDDDDDDDADDRPWLQKGIVVKLTTKRLGDKFHKKKAIVKEVLDDKFTALIKLIDSGEKVKIDQAHVETVIPAIGKAVLMVKGAHRGSEAVLTELVQEKFCCSVRLETGKSAGKTLRSVPYEHISKLFVAS